MQTDETLMREVQRLYALEGSLVAVFDEMQGQVLGRKAAVAIVMLIDASDRHLAELDRICCEEGWPTDADECPLALAWAEEVDARFIDLPLGQAKDAMGVSLLRRAVHLKIPCYETARLLAFYAERPLIARSLRHALEDENASVERLRSAAELGASLRAALG